MRWASIVSGLLVVLLCYLFRQEEFIWITVLFGLSFILYAYAGQSIRPEGDWMTRHNLLIKAILVFAFPRASDDIYRFFWDGQTWLNGISAYQFKPSELVGLDMKVYEPIYEKLNSTEYYSVYPPLLQLLFTICAAISFKSVILFSICWKTILLAADQLTIQYLSRLTIKLPQAIYWYAWNPLVLFEIFGNGHLEGLMILFLAMSLYYFQANRVNLSGLFLSIAAGLKLIPLILIPFLLPYYGFKKFIRSLGLITICFLFFMAPVWPYPHHFFSSIRLYFKNFEFNGSIYEIWKAIDYYRLGYNNIASIGTWMTNVLMAFSCGLLIVQKKYNTPAWIRSGLFAWVAYLLLSTTVHPWYVIPVIFLGLVSGYLFPVVWSGMVILSYSWYSDHLSLSMKYSFIALEYTVWILYLLRELQHKSNRH